jgi:sestrin
MNKLLPKELKAFIKTVSLTPNILCRKHIDAIPLTLTPDELCHITLLTVAAKIEV